MPLYVLDGLDGSGKTTQTGLVCQRLEEQGRRVMSISFPDYQDESSALVRMYLSGGFGPDPDQVNAYAASSFYAVDRYAAYTRHWRTFYQSGGTVIATRYVSSNAIHQMGKLPREEWDDFLAWLSDFEYGKLGLPRPDGVIFLDMPRKAADRQLLLRYGGDEGKRDIHERDAAYMARCQEAASYAARAEGWQVVPCRDAHGPFPLEQITNAVLRLIG